MFVLCISDLAPFLSFFPIYAYYLPLHACSAKELEKAIGEVHLEHFKELLNRYWINLSIFESYSKYYAFHILRQKEALQESEETRTVIEISDDEDIDMQNTEMEEVDYGDLSDCSASGSTCEDQSGHNADNVVVRTGERSRSRSKQRSLSVSDTENKSSSRSRSRHSKPFHRYQSRNTPSASTSSDSDMKEMEIDSDEKNEESARPVLDDDQVKEIFEGLCCKYMTFLCSTLSSIPSMTEWNKPLSLREGLREVVQEMIKDGKLHRPTESQLYLISRSQTGKNTVATMGPRRGKKSAIAISILQRINIPKKKDKSKAIDTEFGDWKSKAVSSVMDDLQCIVIAPDRDRVEDIRNEILRFGQSFAVNVIMCTGGDGTSSFAANCRAIEDGQHILVATPGRLSHIINKKGKEFLQTVQMVYIDQFDILHRDGQKNENFKKKMNNIFTALPESHIGVAITSGTAMQQEFLESYKNKMAKSNKEHDTGAVDRTNPTMYIAGNIRNWKIGYRGGDATKFNKLKKLISSLLPIEDKVVIFANYNHSIPNIRNKLQKWGEEDGMKLPSIFTYGAHLETIVNMNTETRRNYRDQIRSVPSSITVSTDWTSRNHFGFTTLIQWELPEQSSIVERRTDRLLQRVGRLSEFGTARDQRNHYCFVSMQGGGRKTDDMELIGKIEKKHQIKFQELELN